MFKGQLELELRVQTNSKASMLFQSSFANEEEATKLLGCNMAVTTFLAP